MFQKETTSFEKKGLRNRRRILMMSLKKWHAELVNNLVKMLVIAMKRIQMFNSVLLIQGPREKLMIMKVCWELKTYL